MGFMDTLKRRRSAGASGGDLAPGHPAQPSIVTVSHHGSCIGLRPEFEERYIILHRNVFPGVLQRIRESNIRNYSIFLSRGRLFANYEYIGKDYAGDMAAMGDPITKDWWKLTEPMQVPIRGRKAGEWWATATLLAHFGGDVRTGGKTVRGCLRAESGVRGGERAGKILESRRPALAAMLRRHGFQSVGVYHFGGWLHCYFEFFGVDSVGAGAALMAEAEIRAALEEFRSFVQGAGKKGSAPNWERLTEVFHMD